MTVMESDPALIANARGLARKLLRKGSPERWLHTQGVAGRAAELAVTVPAADRPVLIAAAWLHDIGTHRACRRPVSTRSMAGCTCGARDGTTGWPRSSRIIPGRGSCPLNAASMR